jgi:hypothetical protein
MISRLTIWKPILSSNTVNKKITLLFLFITIINFNSPAEDPTPLITDIALIKPDSYDQTFFPRKLIVGVDISANAYYKLSFKGDIIKAGLLPRGLNLIHLEASHLFQASATHTYLLGLKREDMILEKEIIIDIRLETSTILKTEAEDGNREYKLSMFVGDKLIISKKKIRHEALSPKTETLPSPRYQEPFDSNFETGPVSNSFPILGAVAEILKLIKELKSKREKSEKTIQKQRQITTTFRQVDSEGVLKEVKAIITLTTRDL